jgi:hypothetical protein
MFFTAIAAGIAAIGTAISTAIATVGPAIANTASALIAKLPSITTLINIADIISSVANIMSVLNANENVDEIGAKSLISDKKPEDFDSTEQYIQHLRENVEFDKEKFDNFSDEKKLVCKTLGTTIATKGIAEKLGESVSTDDLMGFWIEAEKQGFNGNEVKSLLDNFKKNDLDFNLTGYLKGDLSVLESKNYLNSIADAFRNTNLDISDNEILDKISELKNSHKG